MSKKKNRRKRQPAQGRARRRKAAGLAAVLLAALVAAAVALGQLGGARLSPLGLLAGAAASPNGMAAGNPSKEYIYAGGRLVATDEAAPTATPPACTPPAAPRVSISEFRFRGPAGEADEFIELYNYGDSPLTVCAADGSAGWALASRSAQGPVVTELVTIPNGTTIPARGRYLAVNSSGYSLGAGGGTQAAGPQQLFSVSAAAPNTYQLGTPAPGLLPSGRDLVDAISVLAVTGTTEVGGAAQAAGGGVASAESENEWAFTTGQPAADGDQSYTAEVGDGSGVALFATANPANFTTAYRLDAVGFSGMAGAGVDLFREGAGLQPVGSSNGEYSFVRRQEGGPPQDTNNNAADFFFISTTGGTFGGVVSVLGAPGPENRTSPPPRNVPTSLVDPAVAYSQAPNTEYCGSCTPQNAPRGTFTIRRVFNNHTGTTLTRLRFRIVDITTLNSPGYVAGGSQSDLRAISSGDTEVTRADGSRVLVKGTTPEVPPDLPLGGGIATRMNVALPEGGLPPGGSIPVQFALGVVQGGSYRFFVLAEGSP